MKNFYRFKPLYENDDKFTGEYKYYSLESLIKDKTNTGEFDIDEEDINADILNSSNFEKKTRFICKYDS